MFKWNVDLYVKRTVSDVHFYWKNELYIEIIFKLNLLWDFYQKIEIISLVMAMIIVRENAPEFIAVTRKKSTIITFTLVKYTNACYFVLITCYWIRLRVVLVRCVRIEIKTGRIANYRRKYYQPWNVKVKKKKHAQVSVVWGLACVCGTRIIATIDFGAAYSGQERSLW